MESTSEEIHCDPNMETVFPEGTPHVSEKVQENDGTFLKGLADLPSNRIEDFKKIVESECDMPVDLAKHMNINVDVSCEDSSGLSMCTQETLHSPAEELFPENTKDDLVEQMNTSVEAAGENSRESSGHNQEVPPCLDEEIISDSMQDDLTPSEESTNIEKEYQLDNPIIMSTGDLDNCAYFLKGCKWSPDGTCLLTASDDNMLRLFDFPSQFYNLSEYDKSVSALDSQPPSLKVVEAGQIYDYAWYPFMSSWDPATSCFITSASNCPVHLWDAFTGTLRASYRPYNYADEVTSAFGIAFSVGGDKIFAGIKNQVKIFDLSKPGRDCVTLNLKELGKQRGMMSCIVNNPVMPDLFAVGSYRKTIGLYTLEGEYTATLAGQINGLTQLAFSKDGYMLYSAGRRDPLINCWDLRNPGDILFSFCRPHTTNQRIYFHLSPNEDFLVSGSTDGHVYGWDLKEVAKLDDEKRSHPSYKRILTQVDCVNGVSLHPKLPVLATASGQRHYPDLISDDEDPNIFRVNSDREKADNSVKMWWIGKVKES